MRDMFVANIQGQEQGKAEVQTLQAKQNKLAWNVEYSKNPNFSGRQGILERLKTNLQTSPIALSQAIQGTGGVGKTQIALTYIYENYDYYKVVWWIRSEVESTIRIDLADLAFALGFDTNDKNAEKRLNNWLNNHGEWLLIFDNAPDPRMIQTYLPNNPKGHILFTSRYKNWQGQAETIEVDVWEEPETLAYLMANLHRLSITTPPVTPAGFERKELTELHALLGGLPLALAQAAAFINNLDITVSQYLTEYKRRGLALEDDYDALGITLHAYDKTIATTWSLSIEKLEHDSPEAHILMNICAYFEPDRIPISMLTQGKAALPGALGEKAADVIGLRVLLSHLSRYSLITVSEDAFAIHRVLQTVIRQQQKDKGVYQSAAMQVLLAANMKILGPQSLAKHVEHYSRTSEDISDLASLIENLGSTLRKLGRYQLAWQMYQRHLTISKELYEPDHPYIANSLHELGRVLMDLGKYKEAKSLAEQALAIYKKSYEPDHPYIANSLRDLGRVLRSLGKYEEAKSLFEQALAIHKKSYEPDHPAIANSLHELGLVLRNLGKYKEAKSLAEQALAIYKKSYEPDHPYVAVTLHELGLVLRNLGKYEEAKSLFEQALAIYKKSYEPDHPYVAVTLHELGRVLRNLGKYKEAKSLAEQALAIYKKSYEPDHPYIAITKVYFADLLTHVHDLQTAKQLFDEAFASLSEVWSESHPRMVEFRGYQQNLLTKMANIDKLEDDN